MTMCNVKVGHGGKPHARQRFLVSSMSLPWFYGTQTPGIVAVKKALRNPLNGNVST